MKTAAIIIGLTICVAAKNAAALSYLGPGRSVKSAVIEDDDRGRHEVHKGDVLSELGEVQAIGEDEVVFERILSEEERNKLRAEGLLAPDVRRFRLYRLPDPQIAE